MRTWLHVVVLILLSPTTLAIPDQRMCNWLEGEEEDEDYCPFPLGNDDPTDPPSPDDPPVPELCEGESCFNNAPIVCGSVCVDIPCANVISLVCAEGRCGWSDWGVTGTMLEGDADGTDVLVYAKCGGTTVASCVVANTPGLACDSGIQGGGSGAVSIGASYWSGNGAYKVEVTAYDPVAPERACKFVIDSLYGVLTVACT